MYRECGARLRRPWRTRASTRSSCSATATWCTRPAPVGRCSTPGCPTSSVRSRSCSPTTSIRTCSCRSARARVRVAGSRRPRARSAVPRIRRGRRAFRHGAGRSGARRCDRRGRRADRRDAPRGGPAVPGGPPSDAAQVVGPAKLVKTPDQIACIRKACRITEEAMVDVQKALAPGVRQIDLSAAVRPPRIRTRRDRQHARGDLAGDADDEDQWRGVDHHRRSGAAAVDDRTRTGRAATCCGPTSASPTTATARTSAAPGWSVTNRRLAQQAQFAEVARDPRRGAGGDQGGRDVRRPGSRGDRRQRRREAVAAALLPRATASAPTPPKCR